MSWPLHRYSSACCCALALSLQMQNGSGTGAWPCRSVWLNQYSSQLLPIVALVALRVFVGLGDAFLRLVTKPKKDPMQASSPCNPTMHEVSWVRGQDCSSSHCCLRS